MQAALQEVLAVRARSQPLPISTPCACRVRRRTSGHCVIWDPFCACPRRRHATSVAH